jgi:hypothetical protein
MVRASTGSVIIVAAMLAAVAHGETFGASRTAAFVAPADWFRYQNVRFGLSVDLPDIGLRRELASDGSGLTLTSGDSAITIQVHANAIRRILPDAGDDANRSAAALFAQTLAETRTRGGIITYGAQRDGFYAIAGALGDSIYYERLAISPDCPQVFGAVRMKYPAAIERALDTTVARLASSLRAVCPVGSGFGAMRFPVGIAATARGLAARQ